MVTRRRFGDSTQGSDYFPSVGGESENDPLDSGLCSLSISRLAVLKIVRHARLRQFRRPDDLFARHGRLDPVPQIAC